MAAAAPIRPLARELPYTAGAAQKQKKKLFFKQHSRIQGSNEDVSSKQTDPGQAAGVLEKDHPSTLWTVRDIVPRGSWLRPNSSLK